MRRRKSHRFLSALACVALSILFAAAMSAFVIGRYANEHSLLNQDDVDSAYKRGYQAGYDAGFRLSDHSSVDKNEDYWAAYKEGYNSSFEYVGIFDEPSLVGLADGIIAWQHDHPNATALSPSPTPASANSSKFSEYVRQKEEESAENSGKFSEYVRQKLSESSASISDQSAYAYIGNRNTGVFHEPYCSSVDQMKDSNKVYLESRDDAIDSGYRPCKRCNP